MPFEIPFVLKVVIGIFLFQLALLWMALPFAIYGIKKRMQLAREQRQELLQEIFWLRKTVETIPGAAGVARRHSQKFMQDLAEKQKTEAEEKSDGGKSPAKKKAAGLKLANKPADGDTAPAAKDKKEAAKKEPAKKAAAKKSGPANRDNEPQISVPRPAASLLEEEDPEEEDLEEYGDEDEAPRRPQPAKKAKKAAVGGEADDTEDPDDDSLDYLDEELDPSHLLVDLPLKSSAKEKAQAMTNMVVDIPAEDEISEDEEGFFVYRGKRFEHLLDAMKQQQDDAKKAKAS